MTIKNRWLLPEGIDEILPPQAMQLELLCRRLLDLYTSWGYELVMPPLIEYLDSLLTGTGEDLDLQTFKLTDQLSGRMMGVRADTTPQVARIDVHNLKREYPTRLCYLGTVLNTRPYGPGGTRAPFQTGAELYGYAGAESDAEILALMLKSLKLCDIRNVHVDLGHVGIYKELVGGLALSSEQESILFNILQRKAASELKSTLDNWAVPADKAEFFYALIELNGDIGVLDEARKLLARAGSGIPACIDELARIAELTTAQIRNAPLHFDLAELRGYHYHTGMTFAAYIPEYGQGIAFGGRYDDIGRAFGQARPATGFSTDIKTLFRLAPRQNGRNKAIYAPSSALPGLQEMIDTLRGQGEIVINELPGQSGTPEAMGCDRRLVLEGGNWKVVRI